MQYITHLLFGLFLSILFLPLYSGHPLLFTLLVLAGSLLPDIDHPNAKMGRMIRPLQWLFVHRGFFHAVYVPLGLLFVSWPLALGYASHLFLDGLNRKGIKPLYPAKITFSGWAKIGGITEHLLMIGLSLLIVFFLFV